MASRDERIARNEALLREVNERIFEVADGLRALPDDGQLDFHCECGRPGCDQFLHIRASDYQRVRSDNDRFVLVPGHENAQIERVVERNTGYVVVDKRPEVEPLVGLTASLTAGPDLSESESTSEQQPAWMQAAEALSD